MLKRTSPKRAPERSLRLRAITFTAQATSFIAVAYVTRLWWLALMGIAILAVGSLYAYRYHTRDQRIAAVRVTAFIALHAALIYLLWGIFAGVPYPQAQFAVIATAIVTFELYNRLNLFSAFGMGLVNLYVAATLSRDVNFAFFLVTFVAAWLAFMWIADSEDGTKRSSAVLRPPSHQNRTVFGQLPRARMAQIAVFGALCGLIVFIVTPRFVGRPLFMPLSIQVPIRAQPSAQIINPALQLIQFEGITGQSESEYYYGFGNSLDLSYRGGLNETILMYVSSPAWSYWRGYAFETFDGVRWTQNDTGFRTRSSRARGRFVLNARPQRETFVQSFYIVQDMPNILWTGGAPTEVFFPAEELAQDNTGGLRVGEALRSGTVYSVVSETQQFDPERLRSADYSDIKLEQEVLSSLLLPLSTTTRTRELAASVTANSASVYDKVIAVRDHMLTQYTYDFYPPPQAPDSDAVDQFLFVDGRGVCEHFVSAMVIMLRTLDIPARFVVGFGSGDYNPITNFYEVRADDAHAWVEVYFPGHGWVPFDPTPGWNGSPQTGSVARWALSDVFNTLELPDLPIAQIAQIGTSALNGFMPAIAFVVIGFGTMLMLRWALRRRSQRQPAYTNFTDPSRRAIFRAYQHALKKFGVPRASTQTIHEHALQHHADHPAWIELASLTEAAAYRPEPPTPEERSRAKQISATISISQEIP